MNTKEEIQMERWRSLETVLRTEVRGQDEPLKQLAAALLAGEMGHVGPGRPRSFQILLGPTGSGKTAAIVAASEHLYGTGAIVRLNMAEFQERKDLGRLIGVDLTDGGLLGLELARIAAMGGRIILVDEIEKAHKDIANVFLGMEAAELTLANRKKWDLQPFHIICTSNLGSADAIELSGVPYELVREHIETEAMQHFRPEVWGRFTHKIVYRQLSYEIQKEICDKMLAAEFALQGKVMGRRVTMGEGVIRFLIGRGYSEKLGARPMRNAIEFYVRNAVVTARLQGLPAGELQIMLVGETLKLVAKQEVAA